MLLKRLNLAMSVAVLVRFSTLYRVDAIEAQDVGEVGRCESVFQYPLSGRCY